MFFFHYLSVSKSKLMKVGDPCKVTDFPSKYCFLDFISCNMCFPTPFGVYFIHKRYTLNLCLPKLEHSFSNKNVRKLDYNISCNYFPPRILMLYMIILLQYTQECVLLPLDVQTQKRGKASFCITIQRGKGSKILSLESSKQLLNKFMAQK